VQSRTRCIALTTPCPSLRFGMAEQLFFAL
jgi:hypothetical protein